jgi:hypothetical protein
LVPNFNRFALQNITAFANHGPNQDSISLSVDAKGKNKT